MPFYRQEQTFLEREMEGKGPQDMTMVFKMSLNDIFTMKTFEKRIVKRGIK